MPSRELHLLMQIRKSGQIYSRITVMIQKPHRMLDTSKIRLALQFQDRKKTWNRFKLKLRRLRGVMYWTYYDFHIDSSKKLYRMDPILFYVDTGASISCMIEKFKIIVQSVDHKSMSITESDRDFKFGDAVIEPKGMVELFTWTPWHIKKIPILSDVVDANMPTLLCFEAMDNINQLIDNDTEHLWNRIIMNEHLLRYGEKRTRSLI